MAAAAGLATTAQLHYCRGAPADRLANLGAVSHKLYSHWMPCCTQSSWSGGAQKRGCFNATAGLTSGLSRHLRPTAVDGNATRRRSLLQVPGLSAQSCWNEKSLDIKYPPLKEVGEDEGGKEGGRGEQRRGVTLTLGLMTAALHATAQHNCCLPCILGRTSARMWW